MGYTHYTYQSRSFTNSEWELIQTEVKSILANAEKAGIRICGGSGEAGTFPTVDKNEIFLNGCEHESHETYALTRVKPENPSWRKNEKDYFSFCKTAQKPYDRVVTSIMAMVKGIAPDAVEISSDGGPEALVRTL
jgi:hypothetical protein